MSATIKALREGVDLNKYVFHVTRQCYKRMGEEAILDACGVCSRRLDSIVGDLRNAIDEKEHNDRKQIEKAELERLRESARERQMGFDF